jgi:hypothetical protein
MVLAFLAIVIYTEKHLEYMPQDLEGHDDKCHDYECHGLENGGTT